MPPVQWADVPPSTSAPESVMFATVPLTTPKSPTASMSSSVVHTRLLKVCPAPSKVPENSLASLTAPVFMSMSAL